MIGAGSLMTKVIVVSQPAASVMVSWFVPAQSPMAFAVPWPVCGAGVQRKLNAPVPPDATTVAVPSQVPGQDASVVVIAAVIGDGSVIVKVSVVSHAPDVMITFQSPAQRPDTFAVP